MSLSFESQYIITAIAVVAFTFFHPLILKLIGVHIMSRRSLEIPLFRPELHFTRKQLPDEKGFPQFILLGDDIIAHVLSFVADAPFENASGLDPNFVSTLTHSLPFVNKLFRRLLQRDEFWKDALIRRVLAEPSLWYQGLVALHDEPGHIPKDIEAAHLIEEVKTKLTGVSYKEIYRRVLNEKIRFSGPIFYMGQSITLGQPYGLHLFEPRYRRLIALVMRDFPASAKQGGPIEIVGGQAPPMFIHANVHPLSRGSPAVLCQVIRCGINPRDGRADVFLLPTAYVTMERIWEQPRSGHLYLGTCARVGKHVSEDLARALP